MGGCCLHTGTGVGFGAGVRELICSDSLTCSHLILVRPTVQEGLRLILAPLKGVLANSAHQSQ